MPLSVCSSHVEIFRPPVFDCAKTARISSFSLLSLSLSLSLYACYRSVCDLAVQHENWPGPFPPALGSEVCLLGILAIGTSGVQEAKSFVLKPAFWSIVFRHLSPLPKKTHFNLYIGLSSCLKSPFCDFSFVLCFLCFGIAAHILILLSPCYCPPILFRLCFLSLVNLYPVDLLFKAPLFSLQLSHSVGFMFC